MREQTTKLGAALFTLAILLIVIVVAFVVTGFLHAPDYVALGPWGDFFGGTLNPILTATTVLVLLYTVYLQRQANDLQKEELALTRDELSRSADALENQIKTLDKQNFEATFFKMLEMHNDILNSIAQTEQLNNLYGDGVETIKGRRCFVGFYKYLRRDYEKIVPDEGAGIIEHLSAIKDAYDHLWIIQRTEIGHYYQYLYSLFEFVDAYEGNRVFYMKIVRAQLSNHELALLFYDCLLEQGAAMKPLVEKYALLKHMPDDLLLDSSHKSLISPAAFGETDSTAS